MKDGVQTHTFRPVDLEQWSTDLLTRAGLTPGDAAVVAESLMFAECRGIATHGLIRLGIYLERILGGGINTRPRVRVVRESVASAIVDADNAMGASAASFAADVCSQKAEKYGCAVVVVRNGNHFGAAGFYARRIASKKQIGVVGCNSDRVMCPPGGGSPVLGSNPIAVALPCTESGTEALLDMATSEASHGKLLVAQQKGELIPAGWAVDREGLPTTDPSEGLRGALLPAAGPKGFGLAFMIDVLATLGGATLSTSAGALYGPRDIPQRLGFFFLGIDPVHFLGLDTLLTYIERLTDGVRATRMSGNGARALIPGELEQVQEKALGQSLELNQALFGYVSELSVRYEVQLPPVVS